MNLTFADITLPDRKLDSVELQNSKSLQTATNRNYRSQVRRSPNPTGGHCHDDATAHGIDKKARKKLLIACGLCLLFMIGETVGKFKNRFL
ncbi:hypothetical protein AHF37_05277 [Paragonimus kellicotti]|nr:hypothetical protein AHF37_05277 [Paragonimus kellicotti]